MPYKHIATHLRKSELACRLHHHQMTSAKHRHSSMGSSMASTPRHSTYSPLLRPSSGSVAHVDSNGSASGHEASKMKQNSSQNQDLATSPPIAPKLPARSQDACANSQPISMYPAREDIDICRLNHVYAHHRKSFWTVVAEAYSRQKVSPSELEIAFLTAQNPSLASFSWSSPSASPINSTTPSSQAFKHGYVATDTTNNAAVHCPKPNRCTVSALLNDQEVTPCVEQSLGCF